MTTNKFKCEVAIWDSKHVGPLVDLQVASYYDDPGFNFVLPTSSKKERWFHKLVTMATRLAVGNGYVTAIHYGKQSDELVAAALWFPPERSFPLPWYRTFWPNLPLVPLILEPSITTLMQEGNRCSEALKPKNRKVRFLFSLVVRADCRRQGLATKLVSHAQELATSDGHPIYLECWDSLVPFYERLGFMQISQTIPRGMSAARHGLLWKSRTSGGTTEVGWLTAQRGANGNAHFHV